MYVLDLWLYRYDGLHDDGTLAECVKAGSQSDKFLCLVAWLTSELASYCAIDDRVSAAAGNYSRPSGVCRYGRLFWIACVFSFFLFLLNDSP